MKRLRTTPERWTFKVVTNDSKTRIETSGQLLAAPADCLRKLQLHIAHLSRNEMDTLVALTNHIVARMKTAACRHPPSACVVSGDGIRQTCADCGAQRDKTGSAPDDWGRWVSGTATGSEPRQ